MMDMTYFALMDEAAVGREWLDATDDGTEPGLTRLVRSGLAALADEMLLRAGGGL